mmetsp:Transcript_31795/g.56909  ORF Transcript_31795/g.56909 Transcript_31795/m.56909 type:complete len:208 (+) Transcript_31795:416-1039(+)
MHVGVDINDEAAKGSADVILARLFRQTQHRKAILPCLCFIIRGGLLRLSGSSHRVKLLLRHLLLRILPRRHLLRIFLLLGCLCVTFGSVLLLRRLTALLPRASARRAAATVPLPGRSYSLTLTCSHPTVCTLTICTTIGSIAALPTGIVLRLLHLPHPLLFRAKVWRRQRRPLVNVASQADGLHGALGAQPAPARLAHPLTRQPVCG